MSSDTGIYILQTNGPYTADGKQTFEFRVAYLSAVENYMWDDAKKAESNNPDIWIKNAREMWKDCTVFTDEDDALKKAASMYHDMMNSDDFMILEYGISFIEIPRRFENASYVSVIKGCGGYNAALFVWDKVAKFYDIAGTGFTNTSLGDGSLESATAEAKTWAADEGIEYRGPELSQKKEAKCQKNKKSQVV